MKPKPTLTVLMIAIVLSSCGKKSIIDKTAVSGVENAEISLNGTWKFNMDPPDRFWEAGISTADWADIEVPGECAMQGFAIKHDQPYAYKHDFVIPEDFRGNQIFLNFYGVYSSARVWLNGQFVRDHDGGFTKWECDITDYVQAGEKAQLTVEIIDRIDDISFGSGYAKHQIGGILRDVELVALPE
ncbi:MAG: sugar-binding domain-containing protein, partial [Bacteroidota bacterium]